MFHLPSRAARAACALSCSILAAAVPSLASAEAGVCDIDAAGMRTCAASTTCVTRATCIAGAGTDDNTCQIAGNGMTGRICLPDCSTMFACNSASDCPPRVNGITATCSPAVNGSVIVPSVCTWATTTPTVPLSSQISYCTAPGNHITMAQLALCHRRAGALTTYTTDYYQGDCDGDGCPNGHDTNPCSPDGACTASTPIFESPFCAPLPALACDVSDGGLTCGDARPCNPASATILPCAVGQCETGWSDVPRCRPSCSTLFLCVPGTTAGGGPPPEQCPMLGGVAGVCAPLPATINPVDGRTGFCVYSPFFDTSCSAGDLGLACFHRPDDDMLTSNYWAGDCDGDGAPNGCDAQRCVAGGGSTTCMTVPGMGCTPSYTPPPDAGVGPGNDAGSQNADGGGSNGDAGNVPTPDSGNTTADASSAFDAGVAAGFSGGGGCRCAAAGVRARPMAGTAMLLLLLGLVMRRRAKG
jgi:hypothetical protein